MASIARSLSRARRAAGFSQRALAERTGIAQPTIARIERGHEVPRVDTLERLLKACGVELSVRPRGGEGVDRSTIAELLELSPPERVARAVEEAKALARVPQGALARGRSTREPT